MSSQAFSSKYIQMILGLVLFKCMQHFEIDLKLDLFRLGSISFCLCKGAVIFNAGDRSGIIFKANRNFFLPHLLNVITFATPFQERQKFHTPLLSDLF